MPTLLGIIWVVDFLVWPDTLKKQGRKFAGNSALLQFDRPKNKISTQISSAELRDQKLIKTEVIELLLQTSSCGTLQAESKEVRPSSCYLVSIL